jgi:hypothetical protein
MDDEFVVRCDCFVWWNLRCGGGCTHKHARCTARVASHVALAATCLSCAIHTACAAQCMHPATLHGDACLCLCMHCTRHTTACNTYRLTPRACATAPTTCNNVVIEYNIEHMVGCACTQCPDPKKHLTRSLHLTRVPAWRGPKTDSFGPHWCVRKASATQAHASDHATAPAGAVLCTLQRRWRVFARLSRQR